MVNSRTQRFFNQQGGGGADGFMNGGDTLIPQFFSISVKITVIFIKYFHVKNRWGERVGLINGRGRIFVVLSPPPPREAPDQHNFFITYLKELST